MPMNSYRQKELIEAAKALTGWAYKKLPWFNSAEAVQADQRRQALLAQLAGALQYSSNGTKPHLGPLSPGCQLCGTEAQIFHFVNSACTRTCFFCPQDRTRNEETPSVTDETPFEIDDDFIFFLKTFAIQGIGFTGGEALLE